MFIAKIIKKNLRSHGLITVATYILDDQTRICHGPEHVTTINGFVVMVTRSTNCNNGHVTAVSKERERRTDVIS